MMLTSTSQAGLLRLRLITRAVLSTQPLRPFPQGPSVGPGGDRPSDSSKPGDRSDGGTQQEVQWQIEGDRPQQRPVSPHHHHPQGLRGATWPVLSLQGQAPHRPQPHICPCWTTWSLRPRGHGQPRFDCSRVTSPRMLSQGSTLGPWN